MVAIATRNRISEIPEPVEDLDDWHSTSLPACRETEQTLAGGAIFSIRDQRVTPASFYFHAEREIYRAACSVQLTGNAGDDVVSVFDWLLSQGADVTAYDLHQCIEATYAVQRDLDYWVARHRRLAFRRNLIQNCRELALRAFDLSCDELELFEQAKRGLLS